MAWRNTTNLKFSGLLALVILMSLLTTACSSPSESAAIAIATPTATVGSTTPIFSMPFLPVTATPVPTDAPMPTSTPIPVSPTPSPTPVSKTPPYFEKAACPYKLPAEQVEGRTVNCGYVTVLEQRSKPDGNTIKLAVAVFKSQSSKPQAEPVIYLAGGPGGSVAGFVPYLSGSFLKAFTANSDGIFFDQRGVGESQPNLNCLLPDTFKTNVDYITACRRTLTDQKFNLDFYNSLENAADINDLRQALGYKQLNLYGVSYGSLLAQTVMRLYPQIVRSAVLDGVVPPDVNYELEAGNTISHALRHIFETCQASKACNAAYPDLEAVFEKVVATLNDSPAEIEVADSSGKLSPTEVSGYYFITILALLMYSDYYVARVPQLIYEIADEDYATLEDILANPAWQTNNVEQAVFLSVFCSEEWPYTDSEVAAATKDALPLVRETYIEVNQSLMQECQVWKVKSVGAAQNQPLKSTLPTLILTGAFDPITPPEYGQRVGKNLPNSFYVEFPNWTHGAVLPFHDCANNIMADFIARPTTKPATQCVTQLKISFVTP